MGNYAPPIPDSVFWPAWEQAAGVRTRACKVLGIGWHRLHRELALRGIVFESRVSVEAARKLEVTGRVCRICGDPVEPGLPWGSNGKPDRHWTCERWRRGEVILFDGPLSGLGAILEMRA